MAKLTGQFTTPSFDENNDKTHKPLLHAVVFVFDGATKATRETDAQGKYSFDLANGEYEVSVYLKGSTEKDRFDMRAGEKFVVTTSTPTDALEKWLQVIGDNGKDEVATYYENLLAQMQKVANDFKDETQSIGTGKFMKERAFGIGSDEALQDYTAGATFKRGIYFNQGFSSELSIEREPVNIIIGGQAGSAGGFIFIARDGELYAKGRRSNIWTEAFKVHTSKNTVVDTNGNIKAASPVLRLFNDKIETNEQFVEDPVFEKIGAGTYKISNTLGLAQEGWTYEKPRGSDGQPYFRIKVEKTNDGCIVSVHDEYIDYEDVEIIDEKGKARTVKEKVTVLSAPRDIKDHERWIDLRFHEEPQEHHEEELLAEY